MTPPEAIAADVLAFEDHRSLEPELAATLARLDHEEIKGAAIAGLSLQIARLLTMLGPSASPEAKAVNAGLISAKYRQIELLKAWQAGEPLPRSVP